MRTALVVQLGLIFCLALACDKRSAEEKGKDYASEKLGFVEGAAKVLGEKGNSLGQTAGKGAADLLKGVGSGVKDVMNPPVNVTLSPEASAGGLVVRRANEANAEADSRIIEAYIAFPSPFHGKLLLRAFDEKGTELGTGTFERELDKHKGQDEVLRFRFPDSIRFSHVKTYRLDVLPPVQVAIDASAQGIEASQLSQKGAAISLYLKFGQKFQGILELRAYDDQGAEIGRSSPTEALKQAADSVTYKEFAFDERTPLGSAVKYELRKAQ